jgi:tetratricopeptide (TPR) repeat protein
MIPLLAAALSVPVCDLAVAERHRDTALSAYAARRLNTAVGEMERAVRACGGDPQLRFMLGNAYYRIGRIKDADREYARSLDARPHHFDCRLSAGFTRFELGDKRGALERFESANRIDGDLAIGRAALAAALFADGDVDNAVIQYEQAVTLDPGYHDPSRLADIRWKKPIRKTLEAVRDAAARINQQTDQRQTNQ